MNELTVLGVCTYGPGVRRWLRTLRAHFDGPCQLHLVNGSEGTRRALTAEFGCAVFDVRADPDYWADPPPGRYCRAWSRVADACLDHVSTPLVLRTDVWDVVFQSDPRAWLRPPPEAVLLAPEGVTLGDDPQNARWVGAWGPRIPCARVFNGGMICGPTAAVGAVARVLAGCPFGTVVDQAELTVLANLLPGAFGTRPGFLACLYNEMARSGAVRAGRFVDRGTGTPWCVVHGNGSTKDQLDTLYPLARYE